MVNLTRRQLAWSPVHPAGHLDNLMDKCGDLCNELGLDIFEYSMAIDEKVRRRINAYHSGEKES